MRRAAACGTRYVALGEWHGRTADGCLESDPARAVDSHAQCAFYHLRVAPVHAGLDWQLLCWCLWLLALGTDRDTQELLHTEACIVTPKWT